MRRARFVEQGMLALAPKSWGGEFDVLVVGGEEQLPFEKCGGAAVVDVCGPLVQHRPALPFWDDYDSIRERCKAAFASDARAVVLRLDSPGGVTAGCFELSRELRAMATAAKKPLLAFTDATAASAAYAIASAASRIFVSSTGFVGSIGVMQALADQTRLDAAMGLNFAIIASGARKVDGNPHVAISEGAVAEVQSQVNQLASMFFELVAEHRGMSAKAVEALEAAMFFGSRAVAAGLADQVTTWTDLLAMVESSAVTPPTEKAQTMSKYDEAMGALRAAAEGDSEDAKKAKQALKAIEEGDKPKDGAEGDEAKKSEEDKKDAEAKAKAEEEKKDAEAKAAAARASASGAHASAVDPVKLAERLHKLEAEAQAKAEAEQREKLLAQRPDFSDAVKETLKQAPMAVLENAVKTWPKGPVQSPALAAHAAAAQVTGTRGDQQGNFDMPIDQGVAAQMDRVMGISSKSSARMVIGSGDRDAAAAYLKTLNGGK